MLPEKKWGKEWYSCFTYFKANKVGQKVKDFGSIMPVNPSVSQGM